jgi:hypothetical protein
MNCFNLLLIAVCGMTSLAACSSDSEVGQMAETAGPSSETTTMLDLGQVKTNPDSFEWFDFRPNVIKKLILAGAAETEHIAILWYTVTDGGVALHYHSKTESVYVIDGTQTDAKGTYPSGTVYFNPATSGHEVTDSTGFFLLAYAAPPDFTNTDAIQTYEPIRIETDALDLTTQYPFEARTSGLSTFAPALDKAGGLSAELIEIRSSEVYDYTGNYLLVLKGSCKIEGKTFGEDMLVVGKNVEPQPYALSAGKGGSCLAMGVSFLDAGPL